MPIFICIFMQKSGWSLDEMTKVFIDGKAGTTGLRIYDRLSRREDVELLLLSEEDRKSVAHRKEMLNKCDVAFLCLPDVASIEAVEMIENPNVVVIDTSTAYRTDDNWMYGFSQIDSGIQNRIEKSKRIAVPGCHASGFIALIYPLIKNGIISKDKNFYCHSITGYSGGGNKMIGEYEDTNRDALFDAPRQYALTQEHKHLKEIVKVTGIENSPFFHPIVAPFYSGMLVTVSVLKSDLNAFKTAEDIKNVYQNLYTSNIVKYYENISEDGFISSNKLLGKDSMEITVHGNDERISLIARYDNLGKGSSGAAIECFNIVTHQNLENGLELN